MTTETDSIGEAIREFCDGCPDSRDKQNAIDGFKKAFFRGHKKATDLKSYPTFAIENTQNTGCAVSTTDALTGFSQEKRGYSAYPFPEGWRENPLLFRSILEVQLFADLARLQMDKIVQLYAGSGEEVLTTDATIARLTRFQQSLASTRSLGEGQT
ncbi:MAG: hypothetical protein UU09_C0040G0001, partial [Microgenomates group bacterium GW2011_GWA2_40_6]